MAANFFERLRAYYLNIADVLRGEADASAIFPNPTDVGMSRERVYKEFLRQHAPSKCNVFFGGFLFDEDGAESNQLDVIVTTDTAPRFDLHNPDGSGKSFSPVEGTLGAISIKSNLSRRELFDTLRGFATIPPTRPLEGRVNILLNIKNYEDWPLKVVYASRGIDPQKLLDYINRYYIDNFDIPIHRRPHYIHVAGKCVIIRAKPGMSLHSKDTGEVTELETGKYYLFTRDADLQAIVWILNDLQQLATASAQIFFSYGELINRVNRI